MNNAEFIDALRRQDPQAAKHLNECFVPSIWRFVYFRVNRDPHLAEDIVAETVLQLIASVAADTPIDHPAAWLRTVAQRRIQDHFRAAVRVKHLIDQAGRQLADDAEEDPAVKHDKKLKQQTVREAMEALPEAYRMALEWKYIDRLSVKVIAERMNASVKSAESVLFRARNALRNTLRNTLRLDDPDVASSIPNTDSGDSTASPQPTTDGADLDPPQTRSTPDRKDVSTRTRHDTFQPPPFVRET